MSGKYGVTNGRCGCCARPGERVPADWVGEMCLCPDCRNAGAGYVFDADEGGHYFSCPAHPRSVVTLWVTRTASVTRARTEAAS